jgi:hypothetical protein
MNNETSKNDDQLPAAGTVQKTTNYGLFNYIDSNRTISKPHVQHLIDSFEKNPTLVQTRPILVNENMEVIDGQHRLQACQTLHLPVYYMVAQGTDIESAQLMNALQKGWGIMDYARSYAMSGKQDYKRFLQLHEEYPIAVSLLIRFSDSGRKNRLGVRFKRGEYTLREDMNVVEAQLQMLEDFSECLPFWRDYNFGMAVYQIINIPNYNHEHMIARLTDRPIKRQASLTDYLRELETAYNNYLSAEKRIRFL